MRLARARVRVNTKLYIYSRMEHRSNHDSFYNLSETLCTLSFPQQDCQYGINLRQNIEIYLKNIQTPVTKSQSHKIWLPVQPSINISHPNAGNASVENGSAMAPGQLVAAVSPLASCVPATAASDRSSGCLSVWYRGARRGSRAGIEEGRVQTAISQVR